LKAPRSNSDISAGFLRDSYDRTTLLRRLRDLRHWRAACEDRKSFLAEWCCNTQPEAVSVTRYPIIPIGIKARFAPEGVRQNLDDFA